MDFLIKEFGIDEIKDFVKKYADKKEWREYVKTAIEKIESLEQKKF